MKSKSQHHLKVFTNHTSKVKSSAMNKESQVSVSSRSCVRSRVVRLSRAFELARQLQLLPPPIPDRFYPASQYHRSRQCTDPPSTSRSLIKIKSPLTTANSTTPL